MGQHRTLRREQLTQQIAAVQRDGIHLRDQGGKRAALRNVHPRAHGCVSAEFQVEDHLPPHLAQGVFVPGKRYPTWIRFSNSFPDATQPDAKGDIRGMAIKLIDVPGDKILPEERNAQTHDFVMVSSPVFFVDDASRFLTFARRIGSSSKLTQATALLALDFRGLRNVIAMQAKIASPLETRLLVRGSYRLGDPPHSRRSSSRRGLVCRRHRSFLATLHAASSAGRYQSHPASRL